MSTVVEDKVKPGKSPQEIPFREKQIPEIPVLPAQSQHEIEYGAVEQPEIPAPEEAREVLPVDAPSETLTP